MAHKALIVHVMADQVFNDMAIRELERSVPGIHEYCILSKAVQKTKSALAQSANPRYVREAVSRPGTKVVVFHSIPPAWYSLIRAVPQGVRIVWIGMGFDYYSLIGDPLVLPLTQKHTATSWYRRIRAKLLHAYLNFELAPQKSLQNQLLRVHFFAPVLDSEFELVAANFPLNATYIDWNYGTVEDDFQPQFQTSSGSQIHILAGNSAYETNNHFEMIDALGTHPKLRESRVYMPLSYGRPHYRDAVIAYGRQTLGEAFYPLTEFMPMNQYNELIGTCGFVVMNHLRQQGLGNIITALLAGSKVYLNPLNPIYHWFTSRGAHVGSTEHIDLIPLSATEVGENRAVVLQHWSREAQHLRVAEFVQVILAD
jgi:hypothetical protein